MPKRRFTPTVAPLEGRLLLSTLTTPAYRAARAEIRQALTFQVRTGDPAQASAALFRAAAEIPFGSDSLLPRWRAQLGSVTPASSGSALRVRHQMLLALDLHLYRGVEAGAITVRGPAARWVSRPAVDAYQDAILVENLSGQDLLVAITRGDDGRVLSGLSLPAGTSSRIPTPPSDLRSLPAVYVVAARLSPDTQPVAEARATLGDTVVFVRDQRPGEIIADVYRSPF